jgi:ribosomal protein S18 acetylase RimI-like enzyme
MNSGYFIRNARPEDASILAEAEREIAKIPGRLASLPEELKDSAFKEKIIALMDTGIYLVAEKQGKIVGHAFLEPHKLSVTSHVVILTIAVHEGYQKQGLGKLLMIHLIQWAKENPKVEKIELQVRASNDQAIGLYKSLGFQEEGRKTKRLKLPSGKYLDDIYMAMWVGT